MKKDKKSSISYEPEADVLSVEFSDEPIEYASEVGNMIVHFTKKNIPVLVEILEAKRFSARVQNAVGRRSALV